MFVQIKTISEIAEENERSAAQGEAAGIGGGHNDIIIPIMPVEAINSPPSRNIVGVAWDSDDMSLLVTFKSAVYKYFRVPEDVARGFTSTMNSNDYFKLYVLGQYDYERIS